MKPDTQPQNSTQPQVIAFPARTPMVGGRRIHFLFSVRQVVDVLKHIRAVPAAGGDDALRMTDWRGRHVPVLDLEKQLGLRTAGNGMPLRNIVVRSVESGNGDGDRDLFVACSVGAAARQFQLPLACQPVTPPGQLPGIDYVDGMYAMEEYLFMVPNLGKMVNGLPSFGNGESVNGQ